MDSAIKEFWWGLVKGLLVILGLLLVGLVAGLVTVAHSAEIDLGATEHDGSFDSQAYHAGINASGKEFSFNAQWNHSKIFNVVSVDNGSLRFGYDTELLNPIRLQSYNHWGLWIFEQVGYNNIRGIHFENLLGIGPKYIFIRTPLMSASLSTGIIYHYEDGSTGKRNLARLSIRPKVKVSGGSTTVSFVAFYQPDIEDFKDYIINAKLVSEQKVTKTLSLKLVLTDEYRSITEGSKNEFIRMLMMSIKL